MRASWQPILQLFLVTVSLFVLPGCWDYQAINTRAAMMGLAIDPVPNSDKLQLTVQYPVFTSQGGGGGSSSQGESPAPQRDHTNLSTVADTVAEGIKVLQQTMDRNLDGAQLQIIILSDRLSHEQLDSVLEELMRQPKINKLAFLVSTKESASDVLTAQLSSEAPGVSLTRRFNAKLIQHEYYIRRQLWEFFRDWTDYASTPMLPHVKTITTPEGEQLVAGGIEIYPGQGPPVFLPKDLTLRLNLLTGKANYMNLEVPTKHGTEVLVDVRSKSRLGCSMKGKQMWLSVKLNVVGTLGRSKKETTRLEESTNVTEVEKETAAYLETELSDTLREFQHNKADVFGFGTMYLQRHPDQEEMVRREWPERFEQARLDLHVHVRIASRGILV